MKPYKLLCLFCFMTASHAFWFNVFNQKWAAITKDEYVWAKVVETEGLSAWWWWPMKLMLTLTNDMTKVFE